MFWRVRRDGELISVSYSSPESFGDLPCPDAAVTNTNTISIMGGVGRDVLVVELIDFNPADSPPGTPEIADLSIQIDLGAGEDLFTLAGSEQSDELMLGRAGANVDGDPEVDVTWTSEDSEYAGFQGRGGNDHLSAAGRGSLGGPYTGSALMLGGSGDDLLIGGLASDWLSGSSGNDVERGRRGNDLLGDNPQPFAFERPPADTGDDMLYGGRGGDTLRAGDGRDVLFGNQGTDEVYGGADSDSLVEGRFPDDGDILFGGTGNDIAEYLWRTRPVFASLDGLSNDGAAGEGDWIGPNGDVERLLGGTDDDVLVGDGNGNMLDGLTGNDVLRGLGGPDAMWGADGNDALRGNNGADHLLGGEGPDRLDGGAGDDDCDAGSDAGDVEQNC